MGLSDVQDISWTKNPEPTPEATGRDFAAVENRLYHLFCLRLYFLWKRRHISCLGFWWILRVNLKRANSNTNSASIVWRTPFNFWRQSEQFILSHQSPNLYRIKYKSILNIRAYCLNLYQSLLGQLSVSYVCLVFCHFFKFLCSLIAR